MDEDISEAGIHMKKLETFDRSEHLMVKDTVATFETDELTAVCPFDFGGPDFYDLTIKYRPDNQHIESKSLKKFVESYRSREISAEDLCNEIYDSIVLKAAPDLCYVRLEQQRRGGIEETVEAGDMMLHDE